MTRIIHCQTFCVSRVNVLVLQKQVAHHYSWQSICIDTWEKKIILYFNTWHACKVFEDCIRHHLFTIPDLMMTSWTMARVVDSPTLVGQRFGSAKSLLMTVNLHRHLKKEKYSLVQTRPDMLEKFLKIVSDFIIWLYLISTMISWTIARRLDGPTLVSQGLH